MPTPLDSTTTSVLKGVVLMSSRVSELSGAICHRDGTARKLVSAWVVLVDEATDTGTSVTVE
jgi:hypothetical protein